MELLGRHVVLTGAAGGIGAALAHCFHVNGARALTLADRDEAGVLRVARAVGGLAVAADLTTEAAVTELIERAERRHGPVDVFVSNAGAVVRGGVEVDDDGFTHSWELHVMAHLWAARRLVPGMLERGEGYLLVTASAAGLLTNVRSLPYTISKHAAVALAEWLSIRYGDAGIRSSCVCPLGVRTAMLWEDPVAASERASGRTLAPEDVADAVLAGMRDERCLILPHEEVDVYMRRRALDHERWLRGMRALEPELRA